MDFPNILLRGCIRSNEALEYVKHILGGSYVQEHGNAEEIPMGTMKPASVIRWSWGVQIYAHPYRNTSADWWDMLLALFSETGEVVGVTGNVKIIVIHCIDLLNPVLQRIIRKHLEEDYRSLRFIMTAAKDTILERSLESRCVTMTRNEDDEHLTLPEPRDWEDAKNMWLADIPVYRILDSFFQPEIDRTEPGSDYRKSLILGWCRYSDALKFCYQEMNILSSAYRWLLQEKKMNDKRRQAEEKNMLRKTKKTAVKTAAIPQETADLAKLTVEPTEKKPRNTRKPRGKSSVS